MAAVDEISELFASPGSTLPADVVDELLAIVRLMSISAQEVFYKWESYVIKMGVDTTSLDYNTVKDFKKDLQDALERESRARGHAMHGAAKKSSSATPRAGANPTGAVFDMIDGMASATPSSKFSSSAKRKAADFSTPAAKSVKSGLQSSPSDSKNTALTGTGGSAVAFEQRQNAGDIVESINDHLAPASAPSDLPSKAPVTLKAHTQLPTFAYKGMAMKLSEASEILDDRIDSFTELVQEHHQLEDSAFGNPAAQSTSEIVAVGRIACDVPNGRLNNASVVIETSRRMGAGMRVPLKFEGVGYDVFPGKIVALRGTNVSGEQFTVTEVLELPPLSVAASTVAELDTHNKRLKNANDDGIRPLNLLVASGPYTTDTDLSFAPLHAILSNAEEQKADALILTGPFLDLEHPLVAAGDFEDHLPAGAKIEPDRATLNDVFRVLIGEPIQQLVRQVPTTTIVMVPSVRDAINRHVSWPQDRFPKPALGLPKQVQVVTNPITLSINEMVFGISSQDVLAELRRENVYQPGKNQSRSPDLLARLSSAVIEQRHFFPVFPPQAREDLTKPTAIINEVPDLGSGGGTTDRTAVGASLDLGYLKLGEWLNVRPDVLILPSILTPFAKVVDSIVCINPGTLSKKRGPGTFAALTVHPRIPTDQERAAAAAAAAEVEDHATSSLVHNVFDRARVDVTKI